MKVVELLEQRRQNWNELERLCDQLEKRSKRRLGAESIAALRPPVPLRLCRSGAGGCVPACRSIRSPICTSLWGGAHNQLYRTRKFNVRGWVHEMLYVLPPRLFRDNSLRLAFVLFWGIFLASMVLAY